MQELKAEPRGVVGKRVKSLRNQGFLPAVIYGEGLPSLPISVKYKEFEKAHKEAGESTLLKLKVDGEPHNVLIHDLVYDPLTGRALHADFYAVRMDKVIHTNVPIEFSGESPAVKNEGGILVKVVHELEVEALPADLPHVLAADLSSLRGLGSKIAVKDIPRPKGVKFLIPDDEVIAVVEAPRSEEELAALAEVPVAETAEVKTEQEVKKESKAAEAAETEVKSEDIQLKKEEKK